MSLFSTREWWATSVLSTSLSSSFLLNKDKEIEEDNDTEYDAGCIAVGRLDSNSSGREKDDEDQYIVVGSLSGVLCIYYPRKDIRHKVHNSLPSLKESGKIDRLVESKSKDLTSSNDSTSYSSSSLSYTAEDLLLEEDLPHPILQVGIGNFITNTSNSSISNKASTTNSTILYERGLAILHPHKLCVYKVEAIRSSVGTSGLSGLNTHYDENIDDQKISNEDDNTDNKNIVKSTRFKVVCHNLIKVYEHNLGLHGDGKHYTAYNMCWGAFGTALNPEKSKTYQKDLICVQSMDGRIQIFDHEVHGFTRRLYDANGKPLLLPGPLSFSSVSDTFLLSPGSSKDGTVIAYSYNQLANATYEEEVQAENCMKNHDNDPLNSNVSKKVSRVLEPQWICQTGEYVQSIEVACVTKQSHPQSPDIVITGERSFLILSTKGKIRTTKRMDAPIMCSSVYSRDKNANNASDNLIVVTYNDNYGYVVPGTKEKENTVPAACLQPYPANLYIFRDVPLAENMNIVTATRSASLNIQLIWCSRLPVLPIYVSVGTFGGHKGMLTLMDDLGKLSVNYLGTDPPTSSSSTLGSRTNPFLNQTAAGRKNYLLENTAEHNARNIFELSQNEIEKEHKKLMEIVREAHNEGKDGFSNSNLQTKGLKTSKEGVQMRIEVKEVLDELYVEDKKELEEEEEEENEEEEEDDEDYTEEEENDLGKIGVDNENKDRIKSQFTPIFSRNPVTYRKVTATLYISYNDIINRKGKGSSIDEAELSISTPRHIRLMEKHLRKSLEEPTKKSISGFDDGWLIQKDKKVNRSCYTIRLGTIKANSTPLALPLHFRVRGIPKRNLRCNSESDSSYLWSMLLPDTLEVNLLLSYSIESAVGSTESGISYLGGSQIIEKSITLPLAMSFILSTGQQVASSSNTAEKIENDSKDQLKGTISNDFPPGLKITLSTNKPPVPLPTLFDDIYTSER